MGAAHYLITIGGISSVTTSYRVENLEPSFEISIKKARMNLNGTYRVT